MVKKREHNTEFSMTNDPIVANEYLIQRSLFTTLPNQANRSIEGNFRPLDDYERDVLLRSLIALYQIRGIGFRTLRTLFDAGFLLRMPDLSSAEILEELTELIGGGKHQSGLIKAIMQDTQALFDKGNRQIGELTLQQVLFAPIGHVSYPKALLRLTDPPRWVFIQGNIEALHSDSIIAVVGTRTATPAGLKLAYGCARHLVQRNVVVLSGLARGIDQKAHQGATDYAGQTIAVLGQGLTVTETPTERKLWSDIIDMEGAIVSEYLPGDLPSRTSYLRRNELQVALSKVVIPIECPSLESGTGGTIRRAQSIGTPVIGVSVNNDDENTLISTRINLEKLGIKVFTISSENSREFWSELERIMPHHDWTINPQPRQDRFFRTIEDRILVAKKKLALDEQAIDRLSLSLRHKIISGQSQNS